MGPRARNYHTLDGLSQQRDAVAWYWRLVAIASSFMILGGFLMLPATFESADKAKSMLRVSQAIIGIFAVALLTAGFSFTGLLCFAVRNPLFQAENIFLPALTSSIVGLLTIFYNFLVFNTTRYTWNTPALLTTAAAAVSTIVYAGLLIWSQRRIALLKPKKQSLSTQMEPQTSTHPYHRDSQTALWQEPSFYENYNRNMFPTAHAPSPEPPPGFDSESITEEEMQRQQMLMLLLQRDESPGPDASQSTFHIDWQGRDEEEPPPTNGYYAPSATPRTPHLRPGIIRQMTNELPSWDGVWRTSARVSNSIWRRPASRELREARRQEIEQGR